MIELALPAGSLQTALQAFHGGADAVYLGLQEFSARKFATNFSFDAVSQLKEECLRRGTRYYVALNTLLDDSELDSVRRTLRKLTLLQPDGVIVQDLGLARMIAQDFPSLPLHSSTQLAVHTIAGVQELQALGFSRVVLSRELTFDEITHIRTACPDVELKVFIHGAQCYGFSGLCMASHAITQRSANRGACAQICRTWFSNEQRSGYFFSMSDLALGEHVLRLRDIGIDSLKIEGRMKSPEYVYYAARYYKMVLKGFSDAEAMATAREALDTQFSRDASSGFSFGYGRTTIQEDRETPSLVTDRYPGHRGVRVGKVIRVSTYAENGSVTVLLERPLAVRDGLLPLSREKGGIDEPIRFGLQTLRDMEGRAIYAASRGTHVQLDIPKGVSLSIGDPIYCISRHNLKLSTMSESGLSSFRYPVHLQITVGARSLTLKVDGLPGWVRDVPPMTYDLDIQRAKREQQVRTNLTRVFSTPGEGMITAGSLDIVLDTPLREEELFIPLSQLKDVRRSWYSWLNHYLDEKISVDEHPTTHAEAKKGDLLPLRNSISPPDNSLIPWVDVHVAHKALARGQKLEEVLSVVGGVAYIPLPPVSFSEGELFEDLNALVASIPIPVRVGLNNIGQLSWAKEHSETACFADVYLYMTNRLAVSLFLEEAPHAVGLYRWVERAEQDTTHWPAVASDAMATHSPFTLPLFISRACYRYDALKLPCKGCPRRGNWVVEQNGRYYRVSVRDCLTVVSEEPE